MERVKIYSFLCHHPWGSVYPVIKLEFSDKVAAANFKNNFSFTGKAGHVKNSIFTTSGFFAIKALTVLKRPIPLYFLLWAASRKNSTWHHFITDSQVINEAQNYETRNGWRNAGKFYGIAHHRRKYLLKECTKHMRRKIFPLNEYQVYAYEFSNKSVYVGLTCAPVDRHVEHKRAGPVYTEIGKGSKYNFVEIATNISPDQASDLEIAKIAEYTEAGWTILNKDKGGSLGQLAFKWSFEKILGIAQNCTSYTEFYRTHGGPAQWIGVHKLKERLVEIGIAKFNWPKPKYSIWSATYKECFEKASNYFTIGDWKVGDRRTYSRACAKRWVKKIRLELNLTPKSSYVLASYENIIESAKLCTCLKEFKSKFGRLWHSVKKQNLVEKLVDDCVKLYNWDKPNGGRWTITYEDCLETARQCSTINEWWNRFGKYALKAKVAGWKKQIISEAGLTRLKRGQHHYKSCA